MISLINKTPSRWLPPLALGAVAALLSAAGIAEPLNLASAVHGSALTSQFEWCSTPVDVSGEQVAIGNACRWQALVTAAEFRRSAPEALWLRGLVTNSSDRAVERWLLLGHARTTERSLYIRRSDGSLSVQSRGLSTPVAARPSFAGERGLFELELAPGETADLLLRIRSDSWVTLNSALLDPAIAARTIEQRETWALTAIGGMLLGVALALVMLVQSRQLAYLYFAIALVGEVILELSRTGLLQSHFWPIDRPLPNFMMSIGGLLILCGWMAFLVVFLPNLRRYPRTLIACAGVVGVQVFAQLYSIFIDFAAGSELWRWLFVPTQLCGILLCILGLQGAKNSTRVLLWLLLAVFLLGLTRVLFSRWVDLLGLSQLEFLPILFVLGLPLVLVALNERTRELQMALSSAESVSAAQVEFLARMSHELRTPLDTVLGNAQLLLRGEARIGAVASREGLRSIIDSARHLLGMIDEILDYARGQAGVLRLEPEVFRLGEFLRSLESAGQIFAARNRNRFVLRSQAGATDADQLLLSVDVGRLRQVIDNLLVNASRHTREGLIALEWSIRDDDAGRVRLGIAVSDTGEGIAEVDKERIFLPFERVGRSTRFGGKGAGMGLPTARQLVELMGGELQLESEVGQGSRFYFSIPADVVTVATDTQALPLDSAREIIGYRGPRKTLLLVDDERGTRRVLAGLLGRLGFRVFEAGSGMAAITLLQEVDEVDLVITDQFMADGDGWDLLEAVLQQPRAVPTLLISAALPSPPDGWPLDRGFSSSLLKPLDHDLLLQRLRELLEIEWILAEPLPPAAPVEINKPPVPELQLLGQLVDLGEITAIRDWVQNLRITYPACAVFADQVEQAADALDLKAINVLLGRPEAS